MCSVIREGRAAAERESMPTLCGGKERGAGKGTRPDQGSLELGIQSFAPSLSFLFFLPFSPSPVKESGQGGGIDHSSELRLHFPFSSPICFAAGMAQHPAEMVGKSTFPASSCLKRELMSSKNLS